MSYSSDPVPAERNFSIDANFLDRSIGRKPKCSYRYRKGALADSKAFLRPLSLDKANMDETASCTSPKLREQNQRRPMTKLQVVGKFVECQTSP